MPDIVKSGAAKENGTMLKSLSAPIPVITVVKPKVETFPERPKINQILIIAQEERIEKEKGAYLRRGHSIVHVVVVMVVVVCPSFR